MRRKNIALFTAQPEASHGTRIIKGIAAQCRKYGYHFSVFSPLTHLDFLRSAYVQAESNIFCLPDFGRIDGLILDGVNLLVGEGKQFTAELLERLKDYPYLPVVSLEMTIGDLPVVKSDNEEALREMCRHAIEVHGKKKICILTGFRDNEVAEARLDVCIDEIQSHGLEVKKEHIVYGDFWYSSGDALARKIAEGGIERPEAVLCTSTHMALGLIYRLVQQGIRVPEDIIVIGFDTTNEGCCNDIILSAYDAADASSAAETVDYIRRLIDPGKEILPYESDVKKMFFPGTSCGCEGRIDRSLSVFRQAAYLVAYNSSSDNELDEISFGRLMESYCLEEFTAARSPEECFKKMKEMIYLLKPFRNYQICLRKDWLNESPTGCTGYPDQMILSLDAKMTPTHEYDVDLSPVSFDTGILTPLLEDETLEPSIFYFSPIHFEEIPFGYSVIRRSLTDPCELTLVYRTWLRFVNNALEMTRTRHQLLALSIRDSMTGMYNRRGMSLQLEKMLDKDSMGKMLFVAVIDMDGLKKINDSYGHAEGDHGIMLLSKAITQCTNHEEICIRAGGDEFLIIGVGHYDYDEMIKRKESFALILEGLQDHSEKPYTVTASIGLAAEKIDSYTNIDALISHADKEMYNQKCLKKNKS